MVAGADEAAELRGEVEAFRRPPWRWWRWLDDGSSFVLVRGAVLRLLGVVSFVAIASAALQAPALVGERGLLPARAWLDDVARFAGSRLGGFAEAPALACFDDALLARLAPARLRAALLARVAAARRPSWAHAHVARGSALLVAALSLPVVANRLSSRQSMNASFDPLHLVNTYGAFGSVTRVRHEVVLQGTRDEAITPATRWEEYELPCKPGDGTRRPCLASPWHYRLDWQM